MVLGPQTIVRDPETLVRLTLIMVWDPESMVRVAPTKFPQPKPCFPLPNHGLGEGGESGGGGYKMGK